MGFLVSWQRYNVLYRDDCQFIVWDGVTLKVGKVTIIMGDVILYLVIVSKWSLDISEPRKRAKAAFGRNGSVVGSPYKSELTSLNCCKTRRYVDSMKTFSDLYVKSNNIWNLLTVLYNIFCTRYSTFYSSSKLSFCVRKWLFTVFLRTLQNLYQNPCSWLFLIIWNKLQSNITVLLSSW